MSKFSQDIEQVLLPLKGFLDFELIKTEDELMLTYAIMTKDYLIQNLEGSKNKSEEPVQFRRAKANMIKWLETIKARDDIFREADYEALITELENIELIERVTTTETVKKTMWSLWHNLYTRGLEVGKDRASDIVKGIEKWVLYINPIMHDKQSEETLEEWLQRPDRTESINTRNCNYLIKNIDKDFHNKSIELYNRLDIEVNIEEEIQAIEDAKARAETLTKAIIYREKQRLKGHD